MAGEEEVEVKKTTSGKRQGHVRSEGRGGRVRRGRGGGGGGWEICQRELCEEK